MQSCVPNLTRKTSREWSLAALKAKERLEWFRGTVRAKPA